MTPGDRADELEEISKWGTICLQGLKESNKNFIQGS
jgi:hypothetical protein